jgi:hypothetical protein
MRALSLAAGLITRAGRLLASPPGEWAAISGAINLAAVAAAANQCLGAAFRADEQPRRRGLVATGQIDTAWTGAVVRVILTPHACPARCEGTAPNRTARLRSAPCLFFVTDNLLPCRPPRRQAVRVTRRSIKSPKHRSHTGVARRAAKRRNRRIDADSNHHRHPETDDARDVILASITALFPAVYGLGKIFPIGDECTSEFNGCWETYTRLVAEQEARVPGSTPPA